MEPPFDVVRGVTETTSGYIGGRVPNVTCRQVTAGGTGHYEAVRIPIRYRFCRGGCGRDARLRGLWGDEAGGRT